MVQYFGKIMPGDDTPVLGVLDVAAADILSEIEKNAHNKLSVHVIDRNSAMRAQTFRLMTQVGVHCEIYGSVEEMIAFNPADGIVLVHEYPDGDTVASVAAQLRSAGLALSVAGCSEQPTVASVVAAMKAGALDYLAMPFDVDALRTAFRTLAEEDGDFRRMHAERIHATARIKRLSGREREVLDLVAKGRSNKEIGREMGISPRTVEIHRTKMMAKLGASNATDVVRNWYLATLA